MKSSFKMSLAALAFLSCASQMLAQADKSNLQPGASGATAPAPAATAGTATPGTATPPKPVSDATEEPYVIGSLDVLQVSVWNDGKMSGMYTVGPDGMISMPLIGEFKADGYTAAEMKKLLREKLSLVMNEPEVNVQVAKINSKKYYIYGEVGRPGEFPLIGKTTLLDAFASCGGFGGFANSKKIILRRGTKEFKFNYKDAIKGKNLEQNIEIKNGDRIFVP